VLVGHVTRKADRRPRILVEHMVDTALFISREPRASVSHSAIGGTFPLVPPTRLAFSK
jgi:hypothetical protein